MERKLLEGVKVQEATIGEDGGPGRRLAGAGLSRVILKEGQGHLWGGTPSGSYCGWERNGQTVDRGSRAENRDGQAHYGRDTATRWHRTRSIFHARSFAEVLWTWNGHRVPCCPWRLRYGRGSRHLWLLRGTTRQIFRASAASVSFTWKTTANRYSRRYILDYFCLKTFLACVTTTAAPLFLSFPRARFFSPRVFRAGTEKKKKEKKKKPTLGSPFVFEISNEVDRCWFLPERPAMKSWREEIVWQTYRIFSRFCAHVRTSCGCESH